MNLETILVLLTNGLTQMVQLSALVQKMQAENRTLLTQAEEALINDTFAAAVARAQADVDAAKARRG